MSEVERLRRENERMKEALHAVYHYTEKIHNDRQMWQHKFREWAGLASIEVEKTLRIGCFAGIPHPDDVRENHE